MGRRLTRKQIKKDEFVTSVDRLMHWMGSNWKQAAAVLGGAVLIGFTWWGVSALLSSRGTAASKALSNALAIYDAPVGADAKPAEPGGPTFATDQARAEAAEKAFTALTRRYRLSSQARIARLFQAKVAVRQGDQEKAIRILGELASRRDADPVVRLAMFDLVELRIDRGEGAQIAPELEAMAAGDDPRLPRDVALYELARLQERDGHPAEAARLYRKLSEDYPDSPYRMEAQQRLSAVS